MKSAVLNFVDKLMFSRHLMKPSTYAEYLKLRDEVRLRREAFMKKWNVPPDDTWMDCIMRLCRVSKDVGSHKKTGSSEERVDDPDERVGLLA